MDGSRKAPHDGFEDSAFKDVEGKSSFPAAPFVSAPAHAFLPFFADVLESQPGAMASASSGAVHARQEQD